MEVVGSQSYSKLHLMPGDTVEVIFAADTPTQIDNILVLGEAGSLAYVRWPKVTYRQRVKNALRELWLALSDRYDDTK